MKFKLTNKLAIGSTIAGIVSATLLTFGGVAQADCFQYNPNGFPTSSTPVFNNICGVPNLGNESDFVRVRPDVTGSDEDNNGNPAYTVGTLSTACTDGAKFDVYNYLHNDASQDDNNNGAGSAVAHDVVTHMTAPLGQTSNQFQFGDTVTASNAATVQDSATLKCSDGNNYKLSLVPSTVHIYSIPYGGWRNLDDSSVNSAVKLGSPNFGSGDQWGCWNYRIVVVYQVKVTKVVTPQITATCDLFTVLANSDRTVTVNTFKFTAENVNFTSAVINWGDQSNNVTLTNANDVVGQTHQYSANGTFNISVLVTFSNGATAGGPNSSCSQNVTFSPTTPPTVTPPTPTPTTPAPTELVNTGAGSTIGLFAAATAAAAVLHRLYLGRRLSRQ